MSVLLIVNSFGGIVAGIWLAVLGEWGAIGYAILGLFSHFLISLLLLPSLLLAAPGALFEEKGRHGIAMILAAGSALYVSVLATVWAVFVMSRFVSRATPESLLPVLLMSYGVATGPWAFLATKDQQGGGNEYSAIATFFLQVGYLVSAIVFFIARQPVTATLIIAGAMLLNWVLQIIVLEVQSRAARRNASGSLDELLRSIDES